MNMRKRNYRKTNKIERIPNKILDDVLDLYIHKPKECRLDVMVGFINLKTFIFIKQNRFDYNLFKNVWKYEIYVLPL